MKIVDAQPGARGVRNFAALRPGDRLERVSPLIARAGFYFDEGDGVAEARNDVDFFVTSAKVALENRPAMGDEMRYQVVVYRAIPETNTVWREVFKKTGNDVMETLDLAVAWAEETERG